MTLLGALWNGNCQPLVGLTPTLMPFLNAFTFPLVFLEHNEPKMRDVSVFMGDDQIISDVPLADLLCSELDLQVAPGSIVVVLGPQLHAGFGLGMRVTAEILHMLISRFVPGQEMSLFEWAFSSLAQSWGFGDFEQDRSFTLACQAVIAEVLGSPCGEGEIDLHAYIRMVEEDHVAGECCPALAALLSATTSLEDWQNHLWQSYQSMRDTVLLAKGSASIA